MNMEDDIRKNYNLEIINIIKNEESSDGNVYNIQTSNNKYIAKIYNNLDKANSIIELYTYLDKLNVPQIIRTKDGKKLLKIDNSYIIIYSFLEGKTVKAYLNKNNSYSKNTITLIAKELRKIHDITANKDFNFPKAQFANNLERKSILHFDLTQENIFINNDNYYKDNETELKKVELNYIKGYIENWVDYILNGHEMDTSLKNSFELKKTVAKDISIII